MNGVHDMGGMHGFGPVEPEANEPVFHHRWEARTHAITKALGSWGKWNIDYVRHQRELIPPAEYLRMSYYEKWFTALAGQIVKVGLVTREELESGQPAPVTSKATPPLTVEGVHEAIFGPRPFTRDMEVAARFKPGDRVRARNLIRPGTHAYPVTRGITWASSGMTTGCMCSPTPTPTSKANIPNISIPCVSRRRSCGATRPRPGTPSTLTCGRAILTARDAKQSAPAVRPSLRDPSFARQPRDAGEPVFAEPWQAQAFALAIKLSEAGWFTWVEWAAALAQEIKTADAADVKEGALRTMALATMSTGSPPSRNSWRRRGSRRRRQSRCAKRNGRKPTGTHPTASPSSCASVRKRGDGSSRGSPARSAGYGGRWAGRMRLPFFFPTSSQTISVVISQKGSAQICSKSLRARVARLDFAVERERPNRLTGALGKGRLFAH